MWFKQNSSTPETNQSTVPKTDDIPFDQLPQAKQSTGKDFDRLKKRLDELQKKHKLLQIIYNLTQNIYHDSENVDIIPHIVTAIKSFFPSATIAFVTTFPKNPTDPNTILFYTEEPLGNIYVNKIIKSLVNGLNTIPAFQASDGKKNIWTVDFFKAKIVDSEIQENIPAEPFSQINIPLAVPNVISILVNISSQPANSFGIRELNIIYEIINSASRTIEQLGYFLSYKEKNIKLNAELEKTRNFIIPREAKMREIKKEIEFLKKNNKNL